MARKTRTSYYDWQDAENTRNRERIDEPPHYRETRETFYVDPRERDQSSEYLPNRRMQTRPRYKSRGRNQLRGDRPIGGPSGPLLYKVAKQANVDRSGEWAPGEFQRSYPKNKKNANWYRTHSYGRRAGDDYDSWRRIAGPPSPKGSPKVAKTAGNWHPKPKPKPKLKPKIPNWAREAAKKRRG